jgi:hypothetical protein
MNAFLEDIKNEADAERRKELERNKKSGKEKKEKSFKPSGALSRKVFHKIYPHQPHFMLWTVLPLMLATMGFTLWFCDKPNYAFLLPYSWGIVALAIVVRIVFFIRELMDYNTYRNWTNTVGFSINGWSRLGESPKFPHYLHWDRQVELKVHLKENTDASVTKLIEDVLYLFTKRANGSYYVADMIQPSASGDRRLKWKSNGSLTVCGSANSSVMGQMYVCINKNLRVVQQQYNAIESVTINYNKDMIEVQPEQSSD